MFFKNVENLRTNTGIPARKRGSRRALAGRGSRGAIYTVCFIGFVIPCVLALGDTILQAALCFYNQQRIDYVANEVIDHFESVSDLEEGTFDYLFLALAKANKMQLQSAKSQISVCTDEREETIAIKITGRFENSLGLFTGFRPFVKTYKVKLSKFETLGYVAINGYPLSDFDPTRGLSAYLPIYRPSPASPTWQFAQDNNIGAVKKSACNNAQNNDRKPENWKQISDGVVSIY